jgi:hypothetical protein
MPLLDLPNELLEMIFDWVTGDFSDDGRALVNTSQRLREVLVPRYKHLLARFIACPDWFRFGDQCDKAGRIARTLRLHHPTTNPVIAYKMTTACIALHSDPVRNGWAESAWPYYYQTIIKEIIAHDDLWILLSAFRAFSVPTNRAAGVGELLSSNSRPSRRHKSACTAFLLGEGYCSCMVWTPIDSQEKTLPLKDLVGFARRTCNACFTRGRPLPQ